MNYYKIQSDLLKLLIQNKPGPCFSPAVTDQDVIFSDGKFLAVIPKDKCFLSISNPKLKYPSLKDFFNSYYDGKYDYRIAKVSYQLDAHPAGSNKKIPCRRLVSEKSMCFIQNKYLKYFDSDATYYIHSFNALVFVVENDELVGAICPVNIREEDIIV